MIVSMFLVPLLFVILTVVAVGNPAATPPGNGLVDSMTEEPEVLSPEVVGKVDQNWLRDVKAAMRSNTCWNTRNSRQVSFPTVFLKPK